MKKSYEPILTRIMQDQALHARFLNTLSLMELHGANKLARTKSLHHQTFFLEHMAEEFRHAYFLRKLAVKLAGCELSYDVDDVIHKKSARNYIYNLDRNISVLLNRHCIFDKNLLQKYAYSLTTFVVESRALPFYQSYQYEIDKRALSINIKSIISEEEHHLSHIQSQLKEFGLERFIDEALALEERLFSAWWNAIHADLSLLAA